MDGNDIAMLIVVGVIVGIVIGGFIFDWGGTSSIEELGKSICEEEYGLDYGSYCNDVLRCKPFKESYDGIRVEVPKGSEVT